MINATRSTHNQEIVNSYVTGYNKGKLDSKIEFIEKACEWLEEKNKMCMYELEMILGGNFINDFKKAMEEQL